MHKLMLTILWNVVEVLLNFLVHTLASQTWLCGFGTSNFIEFFARKWGDLSGGHALKHNSQQSEVSAQCRSIMALFKFQNGPQYYHWSSPHTSPAV